MPGRDKAVSGKFSVVKNETLRLEARFEEQQLIDITEAERAEAARRKKAEAAKLEEQKKAVAEAKKPEPKKAEIKKHEPKKSETKNPKEAFRDLHLNIIKIYPETEVPVLRVTSKVNPQVITKYSETKDQSGKYRTKQGMLLCEAGPRQKVRGCSCTDDTGKRCLPRAQARDHL
jgi:hypothetical protein